MKNRFLFRHFYATAIVISFSLHSSLGSPQPYTYNKTWDQWLNGFCSLCVCACDSDSAVHATEVSIFIGIWCCWAIKKNATLSDTFYWKKFTFFKSSAFNSYNNSNTASHFEIVKIRCNYALPWSNTRIHKFGFSFHNAIRNPFIISRNNYTNQFNKSIE